MISVPVGYAIKALGCLAEADGGPLVIRRIAEMTGLPTPYLAKISNTLAQRGLIKTQRGIRGGIRLIRPAREISLYDVCEALNDPVTQKACMLRTADCTAERYCPAHEFWVEHREQRIEFLKKTTLADVAAFEARQRELHGVPPVPLRALK